MAALPRCKGRAPAVVTPGIRRRRPRILPERAFVDLGWRLGRQPGAEHPRRDGWSTMNSRKHARTARYSPGSPGPNLASPAVRGILCPARTSHLPGKQQRPVRFGATATTAVLTPQPSDLQYALPERALEPTGLTQNTRRDTLSLRPPPTAATGLEGLRPPVTLTRVAGSRGPAADPSGSRPRRRARSVRWAEPDRAPRTAP